MVTNTIQVLPLAKSKKIVVHLKSENKMLIGEYFYSDEYDLIVKTQSGNYYYIPHTNISYISVLMTFESRED